MKHVIHIFGASGSGTSTLAEAIYERTGFQWVDTDAYYWLPTEPAFTAKRPPAERLALMTEAVEAAQNAVVSGSLVGWGDPLMAYFTLAVRLELPQNVRMDRLRRRELERYGDRVRHGGDMYEQSRAFMEWAAAYEDGAPPLRSRTLHDQWQEKLACPLLVLHSDRPVEELVDEVLKAMG